MLIIINFLSKVNSQTIRTIWDLPILIMNISAAYWAFLPNPLESYEPIGSM